MKREREFPKAVTEALLVKFEPPITALLYLPEVEGFSLLGNVFRDSGGRFADGRLIRTSTVIEFSDVSGYTVAITFSGSRYVLVSATGPDVQNLLSPRSTESACH